ncbi:hypothetical protein [Azospirillum brasilense]|uniref:hypothetical protein n=1 Tax=Azospirillum brasilense TaxID=192 RepID=UPI0014794370|nr:hypothetical protein [Azospirillum brasilense]
MRQGIGQPRSGYGTGTERRVRSSSLILASCCPPLATVQRVLSVFSGKLSSPRLRAPFADRDEDAIQNQLSLNVGGGLQTARLFLLSLSLENFQRKL